MFFISILFIYSLKLTFFNDIPIFESIKISLDVFSNKESILIPKLSLITFLLCLFTAWIINKWLYFSKRTLISIKNHKNNIDDEKSLIETRYQLALIRYSIDEFELLIIESIYREVPVSITLNNDKVYIGYIRDRRAISQSRQYLMILPIASGYRDNTKTLHLEVDYSILIENYKQQLESDANADDDFEIIIKFDCIISINLFNFEAYRLSSERIENEQS